MSSPSVPPAGFPLRLIRFLVVGGGSAGLQLGLLAWLEGRLAPVAAFTVSYAVSTLAHYLANRFWALPSARRDTGRQALEYVAAVGLSYAINLGAFQLAHRGLGLGVFWSAFWAIPPATAVVFVVLNYRVFRSA
jgi:putative flippase GtrA